MIHEHPFYKEKHIKVKAKRLKSNMYDLLSKFISTRYNIVIIIIGVI